MGKNATTSTEHLIVTIPGVRAQDTSGFPAGSNRYLFEQLFPRQVVHHVSRSEVRLPGRHASSLFFRTIHRCFQQHLPLSLSPEVLWYVMMNEVAVAVKADPSSWEHVFTNTPGERQVVRVRNDALVHGAPDNDWHATIALFQSEFSKVVPSSTLKSVLPSFSTSTSESRIATLLTFMDAASPFFSLRLTTLCGIPSVRLQGTGDDWRHLMQAATGLATLVPPNDAGEHMTRYFRHLLPVLRKLQAAREGEVDIRFWRSIYKLDDESGGPYVHGWITALLAFVMVDRDDPLRREPSCVLKPKAEHLFDWREKRGFDALTTDNFPSHVSAIPFVWEYLTAEIPMTFVAGVLGVDVEDGFMTPKLGFGVLEPPR